jgi:hypothetical protein
METLTAEDLTLRTETSVGKIRVTWAGKSNSRDPGKVLTPFFTKLLQTATQRKSKIEMHFEELEHFNSSTIAAVIRFINAAQEQHVEVALHYDAALKWQALSFDALKRALRPFEGAQSTKVHFVGAEKV